VVKIETNFWTTTRSDTEWECTPPCTQVDWWTASTTEDHCGKIHLTRCIRSMEGSNIEGSMIFIGVVWEGRLQLHFRTIVRWMATNFLPGFFYFRWLRESFLPTLVYYPEEYAKPDHNNALHDVLLLEQERHENAHPSTPPAQMVVLFCLLPGQVHHLNCCLTKYDADHVEWLQIFAEMGNDDHPEMPLNVHNSWNPSVFVTAPKFSRRGWILTAAKHVVVIQKFWVMNEHHQAFAWVVRQGQNQFPHRWLLNMGPGEYDNSVSELYHHCRVAQIRVLQNMLNCTKITMMMIYLILEYRDNHTKWLTGNADMFQSEEPSSQIVRTVNQCMPF